MRHFIVAMLASACLPLVGIIAVPLAGYLYEVKTHNGDLSDEDTQSDMKKNLLGALAGQAIAVVWFIGLNPLGV